MDALERLRSAAKTRRRDTVGIQLDGEVRGQIEAVEDELDRLDEATQAGTNDRRMSGAGSAAKRRAELEAEARRLRAEAEESTLWVVLEGMQATAYRALIAEHPPRRDADGKLIDLVGANLETLAVPLVRACIIGRRKTNDIAAEVEPLSVDDVNQLMDFITERQLDQLAASALRLCRGDDAIPLPRRRSATPTSDAE